MTSVLRSAAQIRFIALGLALGLSAIEAVGVVVNNAAHGGPQDWRVFAAAGARAGTSSLLHPSTARDVFAYTPGYAWVLWPFAHVSATIGFGIDVVVMIACAFAAALLAARIYAIAIPTALLLTFAWTPVLNAIAVGQNSTLGLGLALLAIAGIARGSILLTALPLGALLYKPTYALPLVLVLIVRGRGRALLVVLGCAALWYVLSAAATGGDWQWPGHWASMVGTYSGADFAFNAVKATSLPAVLLRLGLPLWFGAAACVALFAAVIVVLRRVDALEAASGACLAGLALSPHAWPYDAALAVPMFALAWTRLAARPKTLAVIAVAGCGPLFLLSSIIGINPQAAIVIGGTVAWLIARRSPRAAAARRMQPDNTAR